MVVGLHPEALAEFGEAIGFYEDKAPGLGREFMAEVERVLRLLGENPALGSPLDSPYRRLLCQRFPFGVVYREDGETIWVQAVMHLRRRPGYCPYLLEGSRVSRSGLSIRVPADVSRGRRWTSQGTARSISVRIVLSPIRRGPDR